MRKLRLKVTNLFTQNSIFKLFYFNFFSNSDILNINGCDYTIYDPPTVAQDNQTEEKTYALQLEWM